MSLGLEASLTVRHHTDVFSS